MDVEEAGVATPTNEWMEAAQRAVDTDGILENGSAKRQKVCNSCNTLTALHLQTLHKNAHKKRESLKRVRVRVARSYARKKNEKGHPKGLLRLAPAIRCSEPASTHVMQTCRSATLYSQENVQCTFVLPPAIQDLHASYT